MNRKDFFQTLRAILNEDMLENLGDERLLAHIVENREGPLREAMLFNNDDVLYYGGASSVDPVPICEISKVEGVSFRTFADRVEIYLDLPWARICYAHHAMCEGDGLRLSLKGSGCWVTDEAATETMWDLIHKPDALEYSITSLFFKAMWGFEDDALDLETAQALELRLRMSADEGDALAAARYLALAEKAMDDDVRGFFDEEYALKRAMSSNAIREYENLIWDEAEYMWSTEEVERTLEHVEAYVVCTSLEHRLVD